MSDLNVLGFLDPQATHDSLFDLLARLRESRLIP
jgi:hypothetical protein